MSADALEAGSAGRGGGGRQGQGRCRIKLNLNPYQTTNPNLFNGSQIPPHQNPRPFNSASTHLFRKQPDFFCVCVSHFHLFVLWTNLLCIFIIPYAFAFNPRNIRADLQATPPPKKNRQCCYGFFVQISLEWKKKPRSKIPATPKHKQPCGPIARDPETSGC